MINLLTGKHSPQTPAVTLDFPGKALVMLLYFWTGTRFSFKFSSVCCEGDSSSLNLCYVLLPCYVTFMHTCSHLRHELYSSSIPSIFGERSSSARILSPSPCPSLHQARQWSGCAHDDVSTPRQGSSLCL